MFGWSSLSEFTNQAQQRLKDLGEQITEQASAAMDNVAESAQTLKDEAVVNVTAFVNDAKSSIEQSSTDQEIKKIKQQKLERRLQDGCPPWEYQSDDFDEQIAQELEERIRKLSEDTKNFLMAAPTSNSIYEFDMETALPYALCALQVDSQLNKLRYQLVPSRIAEDQFWKNYFYRVQVIRESMGVPKLELMNDDNAFDEMSLSRNTSTSSQEMNGSSPKPSTSPRVVSEMKIDATEANGDVEKKNVDEDRRDKLSTSTDGSVPSSWVEVQEKSGGEGDGDENEPEDDDYLVSDELNVENLSPEQRAKMETELGIGDLAGTDDVDLDNLDEVLGGDDIPDITEAELERELSGGALP